jgi:PTS system galactitol-specific IIA component
MFTAAEENVLVKVEAETKEEVIHLLIDLLVKNGAVRPEYYDVIMEREKKYPTGLPTEGVKAAIPHGFSKTAVLQSAVAVATLARPVMFKNMAGTGEDLPVSVVFLFAMPGEHEQAEELEKVMSIFSDGGRLSRLAAAGDPREAVDIMGETPEEEA